MLRYICIVSFVIFVNFGVSISRKLEVVNGVPAKFGEFPFMASLRTVQRGHFCGCTFLNEGWLLTAAHCSTVTDPDEIVEVQFGVVEITPPSGNIIKIRRFVVHEDYDPNPPYVNDIALVQLMATVFFGPLVRSVRLPRSNEEVPFGASATLTGWGFTEDDGFIQKKLKKATVTIFSDNECFNSRNIDVKQGQVCAGSRTGGTGQCSGDSGGPLLFRNVQVGVVSWSPKPCGREPHMGILTKVSPYVDWIQSKIGPVN